ncbi:hypothetical protein Trydic_g10947 [Trypoxylus dichotomus]
MLPALHCHVLQMTRPQSTDRRYRFYMYGGGGRGGFLPPPRIPSFGFPHENCLFGRPISERWRMEVALGGVGCRECGFTRFFHDLCGAFAYQ